HELTRPGGEAIAPLRAAFGAAAIAADGSLDRAAMRARAFGDPGSRKRLEAILHPMIRAESARRLERSSGPYAMLVIPLLVEGGVAGPRTPRVLGVDGPEGAQIERVMRRSALDGAEVRAILASQATRAERLSAADDVIDNSGPPQALEGPVARLHEKYLTLAR